MSNPTKGSRRSAIEDRLLLCGMRSDYSSSPGDGHTRYHIVTADGERAYTAVGMKDLESFATGAYWAQRALTLNPNAVAASPDLLEACRLMASDHQESVDYCKANGMGCSYSQERLDILAAAIAKAEGR